MTKLTQIALAVVASATVLSTQAAPITGGISFNGNVTPYTAANTVATDYTQASYLTFQQTYVSAGANGSFASVPQNSLVTMANPLQISPAALPVGALWTVGGFSFVLSSLTEGPVTANTLILYGSGTLKDGTPADNTMGTWVATFTTSGSTFSWNSSSSATVPESGTTLMLLGLGLTSLVGFAQIRKHTVA